MSPLEPPDTRWAQLRLFDRRFDTVSITITLRAHNDIGIRQAIVRAYGGPGTICLYSEDWNDVDAMLDQVLLSDIFEVVSGVVDQHFGPF